MVNKDFHYKYNKIKYGGMHLLTNSCTAGICLFVYLFIYLSIYLSIYLYIYLFIYPFIYLSIYLFIEFILVQVNLLQCSSTEFNVIFFELLLDWHTINTQST